MIAVLNFRFWLARKLVGKHSAAINCTRFDVPEGRMCWSSRHSDETGYTTFCTKGDPR